MRQDVSWYDALMRGKSKTEGVQWAHFRCTALHCTSLELIVSATSAIPQWVTSSNDLDGLLVVAHVVYTSRNHRVWRGERCDVDERGTGKGNCRSLYKFVYRIEQSGAEDYYTIPARTG